MKKLKSLIGTKEFYAKVIGLALPITIQNAITSFVAMIDNIMVGRLGTDVMNGVAIANQLFFVFNIVIFGGVAGAGVFCAQYYGKKDYEGIGRAFRYKLYITLILCALSIFVFIRYGGNLVSLYLHADGVGNVEATKKIALSYIKIMLFTTVPFAISQTYSSVLRECSRIKLPMISGIIAVVVNTALNYLLIFGKAGFPKMGAEGAAIATVTSRIVEAAVVGVVTHIRKNDNPFAEAFYKTAKIPFAIVKNISVKGIPLLFNEILWAVGMAIINQTYSYRGLTAVGAVNISSVIINLFSVIYIAMGSVAAIIIGQLLGARKKAEALETYPKLLFFSCAVSFVVAVFMITISGVFPEIYNTERVVKELAQSFIIIASIALPMLAVSHAGYFTMRAGGKTGFVFLVDSGFMYAFIIPAAIMMSRIPMISSQWQYAGVHILEFVKCIIICKALKTGKWAQSIV